MCLQSPELFQWLDFAFESNSISEPGCAIGGEVTLSCHVWGAVMSVLQLFFWVVFF